MNRTSSESTSPSMDWPLFGIGLAVIVVGYIFLRIPPAEGFWSLTLAPIVLVIGYCVIIPLAILRKPKDKTGG